MPALPPPPIDWIAPASDAPAPNLGARFRLRSGLHLGGFSSGPGSLVGSLVGWQSLYLGGDVRLLDADSWGFWVGGAVRSGRPFLAESLLSGLVGLVGGEADWKARDTGLNARLTAVRYGRVDKSLTLLAGVSQWSVNGSMLVGGSTVFGLASSSGTRFGIAGGLDTDVGERLTFGTELQYTMGQRFRKQQEITYTDVNGEEQTLFALSGVMKPPRGFSWLFTLGVQFG